MDRPHGEGGRGHRATRCFKPAARTSSWSSLYFRTEPSVRSSGGLVELLDPKQVERRDPVDRLGHTRGLLNVAVPNTCHRVRHLHREHLRGALDAAPHDLNLALGGRIVDPVVETAALHRVVEVPRAVRGQHDDRRVRRPNGPDLGNRHRGIGEQLEQERLEVVIRAVDLVDQENGRPRAGMLERAEQRAANQIVGTEEVLLRELRAARVGEPDAQELARVVPLVQRLCRVDAVVALEADQRRVEHGRQRLAGLGLPNTRLALEQQRLRQPEAQVHRRREPLVDEVIDAREPLGQGLYVRDEVADLARGLTGHFARGHAAPRTFACNPRSRSRRSDPRARGRACPPRSPQSCRRSDRLP